VKRWLLIGVAGFLMIAPVMRGGAALGFWPSDFRGAAAHERECMSDVGSMRSTLERTGAIDARGVAYLTDERLHKALKPFCKRAARDSRMGSRDAGKRRRATSELIRSHPEAWTPMCKLGLEAELASESDYRFLTAGERRRFLRDECRYRRSYMAEDTVSVDLGRIATDHPGHYVPLCASQLFASLTTSRSSGVFTNGELRTISRRSCSEALRIGVIDATGPGGFSSCRVDQVRLTRIIRRVAHRI
jgi:hypothetical protein